MRLDAEFYFTDSAEPCLTGVSQKKGGVNLKETDITLLCVMLMETIYNDVRKIVREEIERALKPTFEQELRSILEEDD